MQLDEIQIRDPFVLADDRRRMYYLFGSTDTNIWSGPGTGFDCYRSADLTSWDGPFPAFRPPDDFWASSEFWAPEVHAYGGKYFMFATFNGEDRLRGTQILAASEPEGPYETWSDGPVTPNNWQCLDGTLHMDDDGMPWIVFCHEWVQVHDGGIWAMPLSPDLRAAAGRPVYLFSASEAPWVHQLKRKTPSQFPRYVTDGPYLHRTYDGSLLMLWSSIGTRGYAMGIARSESGTVMGPWIHEEGPLWEDNGGHGMTFTAFDGRLFLTFHQPNETPNERMVLHAVNEIDSSIRIDAPAARSRQ